MSSTLLFGLGQPGVLSRLWSESFAHNAPPRSFDESIGYPGVWDERVSTPSDASIGYQDVPSGLTCVWFRKTGYEDQRFDTVMPNDGAKEIRLVPVRPEMTPLHIEGTDIYAGSVRYVHKQATNYLLFQRFLEGHDLSRLWYDGFEGYNVTFLMSVVPKQAGLRELRPENYDRFYERAAEFLDLAESQHKRIETTLLCDCRELNIDHAAQVRHVETLYDVLRSKPGHLCQLGNEVEKNGIDYGNFSKPAGVFWSRGSSLAGGPCPLPPGDYSTAHLSRDGGGAYLDAQSYYMVQGYDGYPGTHGAVIVNETRGASNSENSGRRTTDASYFRKIASAARGWSGMTFHADFGIHSEPCEAGTPQDACRLGFLEGMA